ncbi:PREDICTED: mitochondrial amidoxime-reducing component 1-like isoform X2 [Gekko japonicus]|uniref:Mitochondrial amidoxime-reducing component 1-like isoform X2 n=1 Tax=Gekko japonicus TaxID=146911 RepID=A0ABM1L4H6_GEKJA|nr:PREDICTED: mitochondrial amidoxime-reducing component 1-like isoform X2 [Gekko japonicus]
MAGSAGVSPRALPLLRQAPFAWLCALAAVGAVALGAAAAWRRRRARGELVRVGSVSELFIYPVKSCRGVSVQRAEVTRMGLRKGDLRDRRFGVHAEGRDCGDEAAQWITTFLNSKPYRMVHYETDMKTRKPVSFLPLFQPTDEVAYAEASPILLISEASLQDLNARLEKKIRITNFRPNIVVTGCASYEEDTWVEISIGQVRLKGRMCCPRCIFTKVDPDTGIMDKKEPLKTLKSYRKCDPSEQHAFKNDPPFGWLYGVDKTGTIQVGDPVYKIIC